MPAARTAIQYMRLLRSARLPREVVAAEQRMRLQAIVRHARDHVPLYREHYRTLPADGPLALEQLPLIDKQTVRSCPDEARRCGAPPRNTRHLFTSGTTGEPMSTDWSPAAAWQQGVLTLRMARLQGLQPLHRRASLVWNPDRRAGFGGAFDRLRRRHMYISGYEDPAAAARELQRLQPDAVWGHSHLLIELEECFDRPLRPRVINTAGQELTGEDRAEIERIYGREPLDVYSSSEQGLVAWQCAEADLYHITNEAAIVEVLDEHGQPVPAGSSGELVITGLCNTLMPYLRYRTGDAGVIATRPCRCGSPLPALERIQGRISDWLADEHGRRVAPHRLWLSAHLEGGLELVHRYQVQQFPSRRVRVLLAPRREIGPEILRSLERSYQRLLGSGIEVEARLVERLEGERSHKYRTVIALPTEREALTP
jgi:phenylacetate-CoA ligase